MVFSIFWAISLNVILLYHKLLPGISSRYYKDQMFLTLSVISLIVYGSKMSWKKVPVIFFVFVVLFNQWNPLSQNVFQQLVYFSVGAALFCQSLDQAPSEKKHLSQGLFVALILSVFWSLLEYSGFQPLSLLSFLDARLIPTARTSHEHLHGILQNKMLSAGLIACLFPFCLKIRRAWMIPPTLFTVYTMHSATATVAVGVILAAFAYRLFGWRVVAAIALIFIGMIFAFDLIKFFDPGSRWDLWKYLIKTEPLTFWGKGLAYFSDTYRVISYEEAGDPFSNPHNEYITAWLSFGLAGLFYLGYLMSKIRLENIHFSACAMAIFTLALGSFPLHISSTCLILILVYPHAIKTGVKT